MIDSVVGIAVALVAAYVLDHVTMPIGLENWDSSDQLSALVQRARSDANLQGDAALFITTANGIVTIVEAAKSAGGTLTEPYSGKALSENAERSFTGSLSVKVNGTVQPLPLTIAVSQGGALYAPPTGAATPCTSISASLSYTSLTGTVTVPVTINCGV